MTHLEGVSGISHLSQLSSIPSPDLATVRRFEAAGFRAWPTGSVHYDGTWAIRLAAHHPAKRLNSVNPLDPADVADIAARTERAERRFAAAERVPTFRISPLAGAQIGLHLDGLGWRRFDESIVMMAPLDTGAIDAAIDQIPLKAVSRFVSAALKVASKPAAPRAGLSRVISSIEPETGMFVLESQGRPVSTAICVRDGDIAGLFEIATSESERRQGHAGRIVLSALKWARSRGARAGWLQVGAENEAALTLYRRIGFTPLYAYHYRQPAGP